jgi:hypothetical protein
MAHKIDSASGSITLISEDGSGNVNLTLPRAGLGTAASADTGTAAGNIPVLDGSGQIASGVLTNAAGGGATGAGGDAVFVENELIVTTDYTLSTNKSAMSVGPVTVNSGVSVTIPSGYTWTIL